MSSDAFKQTLKFGELRRKLLFTLLLLLVFRLGAHIAVPNINTAALQQLQGQIFGFFDVISGGAFKRFSIFAMSITPYINASIILQLLTIVVPRLEELSKEGVEGRKKIAEYTRYGTVILGFIQALGMSIAFGRMGIINNSGILNYLIIAISLTAGTTLLMWLGEMITEYGIGNGISLIIFTGIITRIPSQIVGVGKELAGGIIGIVNVLAIPAQAPPP